MDAASQLHQRWSQYCEEVVRPARCLYCEEEDRVCWNGRWLRTATVLHEDAVVFVPPFPVRRVRCAACRRSWGLRPPGLAPHRHYQLGFIAEAAQRWLFDAEATLDSVAARLGCSADSVARWRRWVGVLASPARLLKLLTEVTDIPLVPRLLDAAQTGRRATTDARRGLLRRAAQVLGLLETLGAALGLEAPGLRGVLRRLVGDRTGVTTDRSPAIPEVAYRRLEGRFASLRG